MTDPGSDRPTLRLQHFDVQRSEYGGRQGLVLVDHLGVAEPAFLPEGLLPVAGRLDGNSTVAEIEAILGDVPKDFVAGIIAQLDEKLLLFGPTFDAARDQAWATLEEGGARPTSHAGSAGYSADPAALRDALGSIVSTAAVRQRPCPRGVVAPHIDLHRGRDGYTQAYGYLAEADPADLYVVFGTGHYGPSAPLTGMPLDWDTPLGRVTTDKAFVTAVHKRIGAQNVDDLLLHQKEHSLEFQALFLRHVLGDRPFEVACFMTGGLPSGSGNPDEEAYVDSLCEALQAAADASNKRVCWVAGADLAHLGPFFGDEQPVDDALLDRLQTDEKERLGHLEKGTPGAFHQAVETAGNPDRVCGSSPIYLTARLAGGPGEVLHYGQAPAADGSQVVTFCSVGYGDTDEN